MIDLYSPTFVWNFGVGGPVTNIPIPSIPRKDRGHTTPREGKNHSIAWLKIRHRIETSSVDLGIYFIDDKGNNSPDRFMTPARRLLAAFKLSRRRRVYGMECISYMIPLGDEEEFSDGAMRVARTAFTALGLSSKDIKDVLACVDIEYKHLVWQAGQWIPYKDILLEKHGLSSSVPVGFIL